MVVKDAMQKIKELISLKETEKMQTNFDGNKIVLEAESARENCSRVKIKKVKR